MSRRLLKDTCALAGAILDGEHDADLRYIADACRVRLKMRWRPGMRVTLTGTRNVELEGAHGVVVKVNQKSVVVGTGEKGEWGYEREYNVPPEMLAEVR